MKQPVSEELMVLRAVKELRGGEYVNLGGGLPMRMMNFMPEGMGIMLHAENGILGHGPLEPDESKWDPDCTNAGGVPVALLPGLSIFNQIDAFLMMRGGHLDFTFLGAYEVSEKGDLANWMSPERGIGGIGGAMDAVGAKKVVVIMRHTDRDGKPRVVRKCSYPVTAVAAVDRLITNLAVIDVTPSGLLLQEVAPGYTVEEVRAATEPALLVSGTVKEMEF